MRQFAIYGAVIAIAVALDQWIKTLVEMDMDLHQRIELLPFLSLYRTHNTGIAFSMLSGVGSTGLAVVTLAVVAFISWLALKSEAHQTVARLGFALIVGGAIGNLIDRAVLGYVIDYVLFHTPWWSFAIFNLADAFISIGAGLVILQEVLDWRARKRTA